MSPQEKAQELVEKYREYTPAEEVYEYEYAKKCAILCVKQILKEVSGVGATSYWDLVINEIEKL